MNVSKNDYISSFNLQIKQKSDKLIHYFLFSYFIGGLLLAIKYDTWEVAYGVGGLSIIAYFATKLILPASQAYQYVLSTILGVFMGQYIYQMHGMFEMHFVAFIGSALLITYQNWKLQIPLVLVVVIHHSLFGYLQFIGFDQIYFTQLEYMDMETFIIHVVLAAIIFFICGLWAHHFKKYSERNIEQTFEMTKLQEEKQQSEKLIVLSEELKQSNKRLQEAQKIAHLGSWERDFNTNKVIWSDEIYRIFDMEHNGDLMYDDLLELIHPEDKDYFLSIPPDQPASYDFRIKTAKDAVKTVHVDRKVIKDATGKVIKAFGIVHDITERKAHEISLENSNNELRKSNLELDKFVYSVSHDLRAPLLSMTGIVEITEVETSEAITKQHMQMLKGSILRLDSFIAEILEYSRNARTEVRKDTIEFVPLLECIKKDLKYMNGEEHAVQIELGVQEDGTFCSDKRRISVVLNNLISNAIRYQNPQNKSPFVKVNVTANADHTLIEVADNGIGINKHNQDKIFEMFYRVSEKSMGSGLGLYIVKEAVDKLQGSISVESEYGVGTKFYVTLPNLLFQ